MEKYYFNIGVVRGNQCFDNCAVRSTEDFTEEQLAKLFNGEEIEDYDEEVIYLCEDEEE